MKRFSYIFSFLCLAGCAVGPKYKQPEITFSDEWNVKDLSQEGFLSTEISSKWWEIFQDDLLTKYIEKAALSNYSVLIAEENIKQARSLKKIATSQLFPQLLLDFNGSKTYFSKNGPVIAGPSVSEGVNTNTGIPFQFQIPQIQSLYNALIDASWEIDIFGRVRNQMKAADALIGGAEEQRKNTLISIFGEIASNYMELRCSQQMGKLQEETIHLLEERLSIEEKRQKSGFSKTLDVLSIESDLAKAKADLPISLAKVYQMIYAISVLTGDLPETLLAELLPIKEVPSLPSQVEVGIRSDLIRRRPDVNRAERILAATMANVGIAVANFLPSFTLNGDLGFQSLKFANLFTGMSKTWSIGGDVNMPLFQGGRLIGTLRLTESQAVEAAQSYHQTVLTALQEVETYMSDYKSNLESYKELQVASQKNSFMLAITDKQNEMGYVDGITLLTSEQKLTQSKEEALKAQETALKGLVVLYKSLGGGFEAFPLGKP